MRYTRSAPHIMTVTASRARSLLKKVRTVPLDPLLQGLLKAASLCHERKSLFIGFVGKRLSTTR